MIIWYKKKNYCISNADILKKYFFPKKMMMSLCGLKMAITFDRIIFLIWGRSFLESEIKYLFNGIYFFYIIKSNIFLKFLMTSSFGFKMAITFYGIIFSIWGRPSLESAQKYLSREKILPKKCWHQQPRDIWSWLSLKNFRICW